MVTFSMFIDGPAFVTMPPFHSPPAGSVAEIVKPPPFRVTPSGTDNGRVVGQSAVNVNVAVPAPVPVHAVSMSGSATAVADFRAGGGTAFEVVAPGTLAVVVDVGAVVVVVVVFAVVVVEVVLLGAFDVDGDVVVDDELAAGAVTLGELAS
jgi:hypothetical protein